MEQISHALIIKENKYLAVRSSKDWYWKLPGGGIEIGETPEEALRRELREEIAITDILSIKRIHEFPLNFKKRDFVFYSYLVNTTQNPVPSDKEEELEIQWQPLNRMKDNDQAPSQQILYNKLQELGIA